MCVRVGDVGQGGSQAPRRWQRKDLVRLLFLLGRQGWSSHRDLSPAATSYLHSSSTQHPPASTQHPHPTPAWDFCIVPPAPAQPASSLTAHRVTEWMPPNVPHQLSWDTWCHAAHGAIPPMSRARMWLAGTPPTISGWVCCGVELGLTQYLKLRLGGGKAAPTLSSGTKRPFHITAPSAPGLQPGVGMELFWLSDTFFLFRM